MSRNSAGKSFQDRCFFGNERQVDMRCVSLCKYLNASKGNSGMRRLRRLTAKIRIPGFQGSGERPQVEAETSTLQHAAPSWCMIECMRDKMNKVRICIDLCKKQEITRTRPTTGSKIVGRECAIDATVFVSIDLLVLRGKQGCEQSCYARMKRAH